MGRQREIFNSYLLETVLRGGTNILLVVFVLEVCDNENFIVAIM